MVPPPHALRIRASRHADAAVRTWTATVSADSAPTNISSTTTPAAATTPPCQRPRRSRRDALLAQPGLAMSEGKTLIDCAGNAGDEDEEMDERMAIAGLSR